MEREFGRVQAAESYAGVSSSPAKASLRSAKGFARAALLTVLLLPCGGCRSRRDAARAWPEADKLFRSDPRWLGGDGAYSIPLDEGRTLWLFGDRFVEPGGSGKRSLDSLPRNTIAIQEGLDPASAKMRFYWREKGGKPRAFFGEEGERWLWPAHGARVGKRLLLFFMRIKRASGGMGFSVEGSTALLVDNPEQDPLSWRFMVPALPALRAGMLLGSAVLVDRGFLYAYSPQDPGHRVYLARWPLEKTEKGELSSPQWWSGKAGWSLAAEPVPLFTGASEFSVHAGTGGLVSVHSLGFGDTEIGIRRSLKPEGPWSRAEAAFHPEESGRKGILVYAAKAHAHLRGKGLLVTYAANPQDPTILLSDMSLYYPRFVRLDIP